MCLMMTDAEPARTTLVNIRLEGKLTGLELMIYRNSIASVKNELMIVPFPLNPEAYASVRLTQLEPFKCLVDVLNASVPRDRSAPRTLLVHQIGNYNITVAPDLESLRERVNWAKFSQPEDFSRRMASLEDKGLLPFACGFVIAEALGHGVENDGFGLLYPTPANGDVFFPTAHEVPHQHYVHFDAKCFAINCAPAPALFGSGILTGLEITDVETTGAQTGEKSSFNLCIKPDQTFQYVKLQGMQQNTNIILGDKA